MHPALSALIARPIAHRGLHDGNVSVFENTRSAFSAATDGNYAIELDVQLSADDQAVVFHDSTLDRLTAETGPVRGLKAEELSSINIGQSADVIETLSDILVAVPSTPVVVELKDNGDNNPQLARAVADAVNQTEGMISVMSFSQELLAQLRKQNVSCPVGLTAEGIGQQALDVHRRTFDIGIDFVSYHVHALPNAFVEEVRARGLPAITWTVRNAQDAALTYAHADQITFEGFRP